LKLEKKLLKDNEKFDDYVEDIVAVKRGYLDKLREKRPFWNKIWGKKERLWYKLHLSIVIFFKKIINKSY